MIRINLLPFRAARTKENIRRQLSVFLLSFILTATGLYYFNLQLSTRIRTLEDDVAGTKLQITAYKKKAVEVDKLKKQLDTLEKKTEIVKNLELNRGEPVHLLTMMTDMVIEKRMWFTNLETRTIAKAAPAKAAPPKGRRGRKAKKPAAEELPKTQTMETHLKLKGYALDNQTVSDFLKHLENSPYFSNVELIKTQQNKLQNIELLTFGINCTKVPLKKAPRNQDKS